MSGQQDDNDGGDDDSLSSHCFLRVSVAGGPPQTIVIQLFTDKVPKTCRNFLQLCSTPETTSRKRPLPTYRGSEFHRIVSHFMVQGGDWEKFDGTGGSERTFDDESFEISHNHPGVVSMANRGTNTNGSQFFITLQATPHLDGKHVAFGQVVEGMNVVHEMTQVEMEGDRPAAMQRIIVVDCGVGRGTLEQEEEDSNESHHKHKHEKRKKHKKRRKHHHHHHHHHHHDDDSSSERHGHKSNKKHHKKRRKHRHHSDSSSDSDTSTSREHRHRSHHDDDSSSERHGHKSKKHHKRRKHRHHSDSSDSDSSRKHRHRSHHHHHKHERKKHHRNHSDNSDSDSSAKRRHKSSRHRRHHH